MAKTLDPQKVIVGMSGGVDSSVALLLLKKFGYQPIGVSLKYATWSCARQKENVCCTDESLKIAQRICQRLGVPHQVVDVVKEFQKEVIDYFTRELKNNRTPSPCVFCNPNLKFKTLLKVANANGAKFVATGHYARVKFNQKANEFQLLRAKDKIKDQTYSLSFLPQKYLARIILPLGNLTKAEVYQIAKAEGARQPDRATRAGQSGNEFKTFEKRAQSQDFCFVSGHDLPEFIQQTVRPKTGQICLSDGRGLGWHNGLAHYTIGQRKGLKLSGGPYYVVGKNARKNQLVVSSRADHASRKNIELKDVHFNGVGMVEGAGAGGGIAAGRAGTSKTAKAVMTGAEGAKRRVSQTLRVMAKIRSTQTAKPATLTFKNKNSGQIVFDRPQSAVTPGQICVFYRGARCMGGAVIG